MSLSSGKSCELFKLLLVAGFILLAVKSILAAEFRIDRWTTAEGLPQNTINAIDQTRDGYLWLGTFGGLARFNGVRFTVFNTVNAPALKSQRITALYEDRAGILWIANETGEISCYRDGEFRSFDDGEEEQRRSLRRHARKFMDRWSKRCAAVSIAGKSLFSRKS